MKVTKIENLCEVVLTFRGSRLTGTKITAASFLGWLQLASQSIEALTETVMPFVTEGKVHCKNPENGCEKFDAIRSFHEEQAISFGISLAQKGIRLPLNNVLLKIHQLDLEGKLKDGKLLRVEMDD